MSETSFPSELDLGEQTGYRSRHGAGSHPKRRRRWLLTTVIVCASVLVGVPGLAVGGAYAWYHSNVKFINNAFPSGVRPAASTDDSQNILLIGANTQGTITDVTSGKPSSVPASSLMLIHVPSDKKDLEVVSFPTTMYVSIPGFGQDKIADALKDGGVPLTISTVEQLLGARVDHVAVVDVQGFADMSTALGGITVNSPVAFTSTLMPGQSFTQGPNVVEGNSAAAFVGEVNAFPGNGELQRVTDQEAFMTGLVTKIASLNVGDTSKATNLFGILTKYAAVDKDFGVTTAVSLGASLKSIGASDMYYLVIPTVPLAGSGGGTAYLSPDQTKLPAIQKALQDDTLLQYIEANPSE